MPREALGAGLHVKLCGQFSVSLNGHDVVIPSRKAKALFAILVLERPKPQSRDSLCGLLWPNVDLSNARSSLRQSLNILRGAFPKDLSNPIITPNNQISLAQISLNCDLDILLKTQDLDAAILLSDCVPNLFDDIGYISEDFEEWAQHKRTRYMAVLRTMLRQVYESPDESSEKRISFAETALRNDELDENAVRALMRCYAQTNNSAAALRVYNAYFKMLERELDAEPSGATQDLAVEIKLAQKPPSSGSPVAAAPLSKDVTIAVMPFELIGKTEATDHLPIALLDQITCYLAALRAPAVISSNTTRRYLGRMPRPADVTAELNSKFVLTGVLRISGAKASISAQLVEGRSEQVLWALTKICPIEDLTGLSLPLAQEITHAIVPTIEAEELRQTQKITAHDLPPYHLVLRARDYIFGLDQKGFIEAGRLLRKAVELGPYFAPAHAMFAHWYTIALWEGRSEDVETDRASLERHLGQARRLAPRDGRIIALTAHNRMMLERDYDSALSGLDKALQLLPSDAEALAWSVPTLTCTRNPDAAVTNGKKAIELSPYDPFLARNEHFLSFALFTKGDFDHSADYGISCYQRHPNFYSGNLRVTIAALCAAGRKQETISLVERHNELLPDFTVSKFKQRQRLRYAADREAFASLLLEAGLSN